jgi:hypothetical protein
MVVRRAKMGRGKDTSLGKSKIRAESASSSNSKHLCGTCQKLVKDTDGSIECEICTIWYHYRCVNFPKEGAQWLETPGIHWYCMKCDHSCFKALETRFDRVVKNTQDQLLDFSDRMAGSFQKIEKGIADSVRSSMKEYTDVVTRTECENSMAKETYADVASQLKENSKVLEMNFERHSAVLIKRLDDENRKEKDAAVRAKNVIIFGVEEKGNGEVLRKQVEYLIKNSHLTFQLDKNSVYRLGKLETDGSEKKVRPIRLITDSESQKWEVLKIINALKMEGVFSRLDLNKEEREQDFGLRQELRKMREGNSDQNVRYMIRKNAIVKINVRPS